MERSLAEATIAKRVILNSGYYPLEEVTDPDPQALCVLKYTRSDKQGFFFQIVHSEDQLKVFLTSPWIYDSEVLWSQEKKVTPAGKAFLKLYRELS